MEYTRALAKLIEEFQKFPGIGPKSAQRMAFSMLKRSNEQVDKYIHAIKDAKDNIRYCDICFNLTSNAALFAAEASNSEQEQTRCEICISHKRNQNQICIVEEVKDLIALERTREYSGVYHVLGGVISPLDGISPDDLNIKPLIQRLKTKLETEFTSTNSHEHHFHEPIELILAVNLSTEGEATILYLKRTIEELVKNFLKSHNPEELSSTSPHDNFDAAKYIKSTRLAYGLPVGADLDYTDETTLARALEGRVLC